jgi:hypothetical protein
METYNESPMTLNEIEILSKDDSNLKPFLHEISRFPCGDVKEPNRFTLRLHALQRIDDIVLFHRFVMFIHSENKKIVEPVFEAFNKHNNQIFNNIENDFNKISLSRMVFRNFDNICQLSQIKCIANESLIINLWTTIEQISNRCLELFVRSVAGKRRSHKWKDIKNSYAEINVNLDQAISYSTIDELRVLNNKIKHSYIVDDELSSFAFFKNYAGNRIDSIPLRVFDYTLAAYNFVCFITNRSGESVFYPENEDDDEE